MKWFEFMDMHSGGGTKEKDYEYIFIEADDEEQARTIFYNLFEHRADDIACECCGENYEVFEVKKPEYKGKNTPVLIVDSSQIKDKDRCSN